MSYLIPIANLRGKPGLPGPAGPAAPDVAPTDSAVASWIPTDTQTRQALLENFNRRTVINVLDYGAVGDWNGTTGTDNHPAFLAASAALLDVAGPCTFLVPVGDYWMSNSIELDGEDVELVVVAGATVRTTSSQYGHTIAFMGHGIIGDGSAGQNAVATPQRHRFIAHGGGRIVGTGGAFENGLGVVRVKNATVRDLTLQADQHAFAAQYGIDNLRVENVEITSAGSDGMNILSSCHRVTIRDVHVVTAARGVGITAADTASGSRNSEVVLDNVVVDAATTWGAAISYSDHVTVRGGKLVGTSGSLTYTAVTDLSIDASVRLPNGVFVGASSGFKKPLAGVLTMQNSWVAFGAPYATPESRRDSDGYVRLAGSVKGGTMTAGTVVAQLAYGYRPTSNHRVLVPCVGATNGMADVLISSNGQISLATAVTGNTLLSLDGVMFPCGDTPA